MQPPGGEGEISGASVVPHTESRGYRLKGCPYLQGSHVDGLSEQYSRHRLNAAVVRCEFDVPHTCVAV